jgi:hypothetical protein
MSFLRYAWALQALTVSAAKTATTGVQKFGVNSARIR